MKVILIEDRNERQKLFIEKFNFDLEKYNDILFNAVNDKYQEVYENIKMNNFDFLKKFDVIISHKSAFEDDNSKIIFRLEQFAKTYNKKLVFFSGNIDTTSYYKKDEFEYLEINSTILYSNNLKIFLDFLKEDKLYILSLAYGKKWKLNIFIEFVDKISKYIQDLDEDFIPFEFFEDDLELYKLKELGFEIKFENEEISKKDIIEIKNNLVDYIEKLVDEPDNS